MSRRIGVRTIASLGGKVPIKGFSNDFDDEERDVTKWDLYEISPAYAEETGGYMRGRNLTTDRSAGYVTKSLWNLNNSSVKVDVSTGFPPGPGGPYPAVRIGIVICKTKVTDSDVLDESDWYFFCYETDGSSWWLRLYRRVDDGAITTPYSKDITDPAWSYHSLKIAISGGNIRVYENDVEQYSESFALDTTELHTYIIGWHGLAEPTHAYFDNFVLVGSLVNKERVWLSITASWGCDVTDEYAKYVNDGQDCVGYSAPIRGRIGNKFPLTSLPANSDVIKTEYIFTVLAGMAGPADHLLDVHPYGGNGQADPEVDSAENMFNRCAEGTEYINDSTAIRTEGTKTLDLGAQACADIKTAKVAVNRFSLGMHEEGDDSSGVGCIGEYTHATTPPKLKVTYTVPL